VRSFLLAILASGLFFFAGCGGSSTKSTTSASNSPGSANNLLAITVSGGPTANLANGVLYENGAFASATICAPGSTSNCTTIDNLLVDTGSTGLRVFDTAVASLDLPAANASNGSQAYDCVAFVSGAYLWGPVEKGDVSLGSETASSVPIHVISSANTGIPSSCSNGATENDNTAALLGANGLLGVGIEPTDCFYAGISVCDPSAGLSSAPYPAYYTCSGNSCSPAFVATASQVTNPVALFAKDNNGVIVELPAASSPAATLSGNLVFGIGTESNNQLPSDAAVFTLTCDDFTTDFDGQTYGITNSTTCAGPASFIDSGSNALYFPNATNMTECSSNTLVGDLSGLYCPGSTQNFTATNKGANGTAKAASFSVANAESLFTNAATAADAVQPTLAGTNPTGYGFDWGLPFFYGVNIYNAIDGQSMPSGAPGAPWWAY